MIAKAGDDVFCMASARRAFTLIELIVVVVIIGILAAVGAVAYNSFINNAKMAEARAAAAQQAKLFQAESARLGKSLAIVGGSPGVPGADVNFVYAWDGVTKDDGGAAAAAGYPHENFARDALEQESLITDTYLLDSAMGWPSADYPDGESVLVMELGTDGEDGVCWANFGANPAAGAPPRESDCELY